MKFSTPEERAALPREAVSPVIDTVAIAHNAKTDDQLAAYRAAHDTLVDEAACEPRYYPSAS